MNRLNLEEIISWVRDKYGETVFDAPFVREMDYWRGILASMEALGESAARIMLAQQEINRRLDYLHQEITKGAAIHLARTRETLAGEAE